MIIIEQILLPVERWWIEAIERDIAFLKLDVRGFRGDTKVVNERILLEGRVDALFAKVDAILAQVTRLAAIANPSRTS